MISKTTILKARNADLPEYLRAKGHELVREGRQFRVKDISGLVVTGNRWYDHARQQGGNALDFLILAEGAGFKAAVAALMEYGGAQDYAPADSREDRRKAFKPPQKNCDNARVLSYLTGARGISRDVLRPHIESGRVYEASGTHNCVFTGVDHDTGEVRYAFQRSSIAGSGIMFESAGSDKRYSFSMPGKSETLFVYESAIDLFSYLSMLPAGSRRRDSFLSLGGLCDMSLNSFMRKWHRPRVVFCLDSDSVADEAYARLGAKCVSLGCSVYRHAPAYKDWNEQLLKGGPSFPAPPTPWGGPA